MQENKSIANQQQMQPLQQQRGGLEFDIDIFELLDTWKRHLPVIILFAIIGGLIGYVYTLFYITPRYRTSASMFVVSASANSAIDVSDLSFGSTLTGDYIALVKSRNMLERVIADTGDPLTTGQLSNMVTVSNTSGTRILVFTVSSTSPQQAMRLANSFVKQAITFLPETMGVKDNFPREIDSAMLPSTPYNMNYMKNLMIGMAIGAILIMGIYALRCILNDTFDNSDDVEKALGIMPLAVIPENDQKHGKGGGYYYYYYYTNAGKKKRR